ncbi:hypothetical protein L249_2484 [Ophiocordyceps polyrhachis-furcata BCC 54312]|uniref:Uncharacterized protein n=1 Tax=Ophiocordyceps polyrhachis-furcata BCC 54312 TaxID=1330021 RepID=A0A367LN20_9HYPO|nr:hypothetical protein L249_2484 [Ophiocordyceps polyrhachis-furcata BCC 54312]
MRHVPVNVINEDSSYCEPNWASVEDFLAGEEHEEKEKRKYKELADGNPSNKIYAEKYKNHLDNVSKFRRIRDIFGPGSTYHPNQLVAKCHLPPAGLCEKEIMYRLACKVSELRTLQEKRYLIMDPWDFLRWRIATKVQEHLSHPGDRAHSFIKSVIMRLWDANDGSNRNTYADPFMRKAAMLAADLSNCSKRYNKGKTGRRPTKKSTTGLKRGRPKAPTLEEAREAKRRARRERLAAQPATQIYSGVNAFIANRKRAQSTK